MSAAYPASRACWWATRCGLAAVGCCDHAVDGASAYSDASSCRPCLLLAQAQEHVESNVALARQVRLGKRMWELVSPQVVQAMGGAGGRQGGGGGAAV